MQALLNVREKDSPSTIPSAVLTEQIAYDHAPVGLGLVDADLRFVRVNRFLARINGISAEDHVGRTIREVVPDLADQLEPLYRRVLDRGEPLLNQQIEGSTSADPGIPRIWLVNYHPVAIDGEVRAVSVAVADITERQAAQEKFRRIFEAATAGVFLLGSHDQFVEVNPKMYEILGRATDEVVGRPVQELFTPGAAARYREMRTALRLRGTWSGELAVIGRDGRAIELEWTVTASSEPGVLLCIVNDVSERQRYEAALREREQAFIALANGISQLAWMADSEGNIFWYNERWYEYTGTTFDEVRGWGWSNVHHPGHVDRVIERITRSFEKGEPWEDTFPLRSKSGEYRWFLSRALPIRDAEGRVIRWFGTNTDITELMTLEEAMRESEARFRTMAEAAPVMIWMTDKNRENAYVNHEWLTFTGRTFEEELSSGWAERVHPEDRARFLRTFATAFKARRPFEIEYRMRRSDGEYRWILGRGVPRFVTEGDFAGYVGTAIDITERRLSEEAMREAKERAEELSRVKSTLLSNMSHEVRTPLTSVLLFSDLLAKRLSGKERETALKMKAGVEQLASVIDSVLTLTRLEAGTMEMKPERVDLARLVETSADAAAEAARKKGLQFKLQVEPRSLALVDPVAFDLALGQILANAVKFTEAGSVVVTVELCHDERVGGPAVAVRVEDTGVGIDRENLPFVFDEFWQESTNTVRTHPGTGLGLAISKRIVDRLSGVLDVRSEKNVGSTFTITLPAAPPKPADAVEPREAGGSAGEHRHRLLVMDRDELVLDLMVDVLSDQYGVVGTSNERAALEWAQQGSFDAVLLDVQDPNGPGGDALVQTLRRMPAYKNTPIIAVTGRSLPEDRFRLLSAGFDAYVSKPFEAERLLSAIAAVLHRGLA